MNVEFAQDVLEGLSSDPKNLSSKYFYDDRGSTLFQEIMRTPEYYLTDAELDIFQHKSDQLLDALSISLDIPFDLIELGAGDGLKVIHLLRALIRRDARFRYLPIDISEAAIKALEERIRTELPTLRMQSLQGDYFKILGDLSQADTVKVLLFLGSNIGNLSDERSTEFIYQLGSYLNPGDHLVVGVDLIKSREIVLPAYNDSQGITAQFNLNLLRRINRELGADFDLGAFVHQPQYDEQEGIARSFLVSTKDQKVHIEQLGRSFSFKEQEAIATEISRKYDDQVIARILQSTDFEVVAKVMDRRKYFADYILRRN